MRIRGTTEDWEIMIRGKEGELRLRGRIEVWKIELGKWIFRGRGGDC